MPKVIFWDVDTQVDFMRATGKLYVPGSEEIVPLVQALTEYAHARNIPIVASADDHVPGHRELSDAPDWKETFPEHCMRGTPGQAKIVETTLRDPLTIEPEPAPDPAALAARVREHVARGGDVLLHKHWFDVFTNPNVPAVLDALGPERVVLYGVATDVCNRYAIDGLLRHRPGTEVWFVADAARAIDAGAERALVEGWRGRGVRIVSAREILEGELPLGA